MMNNFRREPYLAGDGEHLGDMRVEETRLVEITRGKHCDTRMRLHTGTGIDSSEEGITLRYIDDKLLIYITAHTVGTYPIYFKGLTGDATTKLIRVYP